MTYQLKIYNMEGITVGDYPIVDSCLEFEKGAQAVQDVVVAYMAGQRAGTASTKTRAEVSGGGKKPFRQKGLGRARAGSIRSPVWRGGGISFGPKPRDFHKKINKKVRTLAMKRAFSEKIKEEAVLVLEQFVLPDHKTKNVTKLLAKLKLAKSVLLVVRDYDDQALKATGNLPDLLLLKEAALNIYELLRCNKLVFTKEALDDFIQHLN